MSVTFEDLYPVAVPYITIIRDPKATAAERHKAAAWLLEQGFDRAPLAPVAEIRAAYYARAQA